MQIQGEEKYIDKQDIIVLQINHPQGLHPEVLVQTVTRENTNTEDTKTRVAAQHKKSTFSGDGKISWDTIITQFERLAERHEWGKRKKIRQIIELFKGVGIRICV